MKSKILFFACMMLFFVIPFQAKAASCSNQEALRYQKIASNVNVTTTYTETNGTVSFQVIITNLTPQIIIYDISHNRYYHYGDNGENPSEVIVDGFEADKSYRFIAYATNQDGCEYGKLYTYYANTPAYNQFYNDPVCQDVKEYKLCQKWLKTNLSHDEFVKQVNEYKESLKTEETTRVQKVNSPGFNLAQFLIDHYYILLIIIILFVLGMIYWNEKHDTFGF